MSKNLNIPDVGENGSAFGNALPVKIQHVTVGPATTNDVVAAAVQAYTLFNVDEPIVVLHMWTQVETAFNGTVALDIGDSGSASRFTSDTTIVPGSTGAVLVADTGLSVPYLNSTPDDILITIGDTPATAGVLSVYIEYALLRD